MEDARMTCLQDKVVVITGGTSGIGRAIVRRCLDEGAWVVTGSIDSRGGGLPPDSDRLRSMRMDVTREADVEALVGRAVALRGRVDVMVNNAGSSGVAGSIAEIDEAGFQATADVLFKGVFLGVKHAARAMLPRGSGAIVNIASIAGIATFINASHVYSAVKAAVVQLTKTAALELGPKGVRVNCICPGFIATPIFGKALGLPDEQLDMSVEVVGEIFADMQPIRRAGRPEDIAAAAVWLASEEASFVAGHALVVDGGASVGEGWNPGVNRFGRLAEAIARRQRPG
jgi:NAD(P)-dependent dehydrogenase (short-subunit alcohol dehydrogenase family)